MSDLREQLEIVVSNTPKSDWFLKQGVKGGDGMGYCLSAEECSEILSLFDRVKELEKYYKDYNVLDIVSEHKELQQQNERLREALKWYVIRDQKVHEDGREKSRLLKQAEQALKQ